LVYEDMSTRACTLSGYPKVIGVTATTGTEITAGGVPLTV
jgi:hypothetical protein